jgi:hypothetical protein
MLAGAALFGRPLLRWWGGSDVLRCLRDPEAARNARWLDRFVRVNVATAPHLVEELASLGIRARFIPSVPATPPPDAEPRGPLPRAVLVYLPDSNPALYGEGVVRQAIRDNRDFTFFVVADRKHRFRGEPNVESLGWVNDLREVYDRVGALLRITQHDGMPRMVLESLRRGRYVIYAWPFPGCWRAVTSEEVNACFRRLRGLSEPNEEGLRAVIPFVEPDPAGIFASLILEQRPPGRRWIGL